MDTRGTGPVRQDRRLLRFSKGPYSSSNHSQFRRSSSQEKSNRSGSGSSSFSGSIKCSKCGGLHMVRDYPQSRMNCSNCEKLRHTTNVCWAAKRSGSKSTTQRPKLRGSTWPKLSIPGRVFAMSGAEASQSEELIRGKCVIKGRLHDVLFGLNAMHSFVSVDYVKSLDMYVTELPCNVMVTTPTGKLVMTSWACLGCSIMVHGREFKVELICLPLSQLDVILGMDWLAANHVLLDCKEKTLTFGSSMLEVSRLLS
ncbi:uncharacterized protein LOC113874178 [Abrus precatorius]|uniref:Uncharacterized protein LOC113874178 n=1 Tax=Abrus precatorius TaxID=3816 RepID=A0A8B8MKR9_ABRPR|nr:uncharacterized protein LOC113874178 [Abrus precatorius]